MENRIKLGISSCLLGENVRWNGGHKLDHFLRDTLGQYIEYVPVCPEVECGLPTPRETMRLVGDAENPRLVTSRSGIDHTQRMAEWAARRVRDLEKEDLCGFIFKANSPSSGLLRVKVYGPKGLPEKKGIGMFARAFTGHFPLIPVEEEGRLHDPMLRENFIEQIFVFKQWRELAARKWRPADIIDFHTRNKLLIMAHSQQIARDMGKLVAGVKHIDPETFYRQYESSLMAALRLKATVPKNMNVLQHMMGYFRDQLSKDEKQELLEIFDQYRRGYVPLIVPLTLINHYVRKYDQAYLRSQAYLNPHPVELKIRTYM